MRGTLSYYALIFSKNEFERALVDLAIGTKTHREEKMVLVVRPSTLAGH
jgi:hypothetical protein